MKHLIISVAAASLLSFSAMAQATNDESDGVKQTINNLFSAMLGADSSALRMCFDSVAIMQTVRQTEGQGASVAGTSSPDRFIAQIGAAKPGALDERIVFEKILIDGPMAVAWTPYKFYLNGQFSHCGVNVFQLVRKTDGWKIVSVLDTRRKEGCSPD